MATVSHSFLWLTISRVSWVQPLVDLHMITVSLAMAAVGVTGRSLETVPAVDD